MTLHCSIAFLRLYLSLIAEWKCAVCIQWFRLVLLSFCFMCIHSICLVCISSSVLHEFIIPFSCIHCPFSACHSPAPQVFISSTVNALEHKLGNDICKTTFQVWMDLKKYTNKAWDERTPEDYPTSVVCFLHMCRIVFLHSFISCLVSVCSSGPSLFEMKFCRSLSPNIYIYAYLYHDEAIIQRKLYSLAQLQQPQSLHLGINILYHSYAVYSTFNL